MPIYEYMCLSCGHWQEDIRPSSQADDCPSCEKCSKATGRQPSLPYVRPESMYATDPDTGHRLVVNDADDPWEGSGAENRMRAQAEDHARSTKKQTKIQVDLGVKTNVAAVH